MSFNNHFSFNVWQRVSLPFKGREGRGRKPAPENINLLKGDKQFFNYCIFSPNRYSLIPNPFFDL